MAENEISPLDKFKKQFQSYQESGTKPQRKSREEIMAKYFLPRNAKEIFRILPYSGEKFYEEAYFHVVDLLVSGGKTKNGGIVYCPAYNDPQIQKLDSNGNPIFVDGKPKMVNAHCPLCEKHRKLVARQDQSIKYIKKDNLNDDQKIIKASNDLIFKDAIKWEAKKFYIIKGIDKGAEKDGVKLWRFKHNFKGMGTLDKIYPVLEDFVESNNCDFSSPEEGTDLSITVGDAVMPNGKPYKTITAMLHKGKTKLHTDPVVIEQWLSDTTTWRDVFKPKKAPNVTNLEVLEMIVAGNNPYYDESDQSNKRWVFPGRPDLEELANTRTQTFDDDDDDVDDEDVYTPNAIVNSSSKEENVLDATQVLSGRDTSSANKNVSTNNIDELPF